jgi:DNA processing protein
VSTPPPQQQPQRELPENLTDEERALLSLLSIDGKLHIDTLIQNLGADCAAVSRRLLVLEMQGLVRQWPGMYYSRV